MNAKEFILQLHKPTPFRFLWPGDRFHMADGTEAVKLDGLTWQQQGMQRAAANRDYLCFPLDWDAATIRAFKRTHYSGDERFQKEAMDDQTVIGLLLEAEEDEPLNDFILRWYKRLLQSKPNDSYWRTGSSGHLYHVDHYNHVVTLVHGERNDPLGWHQKSKRYLAALGYTMHDEPPLEREMSFAESLVNDLLETSAMPGNPIADRMHRDWKRKTRYGAASVPAGLSRMREFEQETDDSHRSFEGEPTPKELKAEYAKTRKHDPVPLTPKNSVTMAINRNQRRKSFGYSDYRYSLRDRKWPTSPGYHRKFRPPPEDEPQI